MSAWPTHGPPVGPSVGHPAITPAQPSEITTPAFGTPFATLFVDMPEPDAVPTPHDRLVKRVFGRPETAAVLLRRVLPDDILRWLDLSRITVESTTHISPRLGKRRSDFVYSVGLRNSPHSVVLFAVVEHQSSPEWLFVLRMLGYLGDRWERTIAEHGPGVRRIPIALPIVLVQCPKKWNVPNRLSDLFEGPQPLRDAVRPLFDLQLLVDDMSESVLDDPVTKQPTLALVELTRALLVAYHDPESITDARIEELAPLFDTVLEHGREDAHALWTYVVSVFDEDSPLRRMLLTAVNQENEDMGRTYKEAWLDEGRLQGLATALFEVLEDRELSVPDEIRQRVLATRDESGLRRWLRRALVAGTIQQVFEPVGS